MYRLKYSNVVVPCRHSLTNEKQNQKRTTSWINNTGTDLQLSHEEAGSSAITKPKVKEIKSKTDQTLENESAGPSRATNSKQVQNTQESKPRQEEHQTAIQLFMERVSIAGLEESYRSKLNFKPDLIMFRLTVLAALIMIIYESYAIACQYKNKSTVFDDTLLDHEIAPFPNISICFPPSFNESRFRDALPVVLPNKTIRLMEKHSITLDKVINYIKQTILLNIRVTDGSTPLYEIAVQVYDAAMRSGVDPFELRTSPCPQVITNCAFDERPFDCCNNQIFVIMLAQVACYQINLNSTAIREHEKNRADPMRLKSIGLTFDVSTDWNSALFKDDAASDGFHVFVDTQPHVLGDPTVIPGNMDAVIFLAQPKKVSEMTQCQSINNIPVLKYFEYYDSNGVQCYVEWMIDKFASHLGCKITSMGSFRNETCSFVQQFMFAVAVSLGGLNDVQDFKRSKTSQQFRIKDELKSRLQKIAKSGIRQSWECVTSQAMWGQGNNSSLCLKSQAITAMFKGFNGECGECIRTLLKI